MAYEPRSLITTQERDSYPRVKPDEGGVGVKQIAAVVAAPEYPVLTPMAFNTSTNKWVVWTNGGANGTGTIRALVYPEAIQTDDTNDVMGQLMLLGEAHFDDINAVRPAGESEANLKTALRSGPRDLGLRITGLDQVR